MSVFFFLINSKGRENITVWLSSSMRATRSKCKQISQSDRQCDNGGKAYDLWCSEAFFFLTLHIHLLDVIPYSQRFL